MNALLFAGTLQIGGLPLHPLIVHAVVVLVPLTALAIVLGTFWPAARRRLGIVTPLAALVVLILVPITVAAGESLRDVVGPLPGVAEHEAYGRMLLPWALGMLVASTAQWAWYRWGIPRAQPPQARRTSVISIVIGVVAILTAVGSIVVIVLIGESGARAVWGGLV